MLYSFLSMGMTPIPGVSFDEELSRALEGPNKHLQASALRTVATLFFERNAGINEALQFLQQSEDLFRRIGNQLESARTGLRIAICLDAMNAHDESENIRSESLKILSNFGQLDLYPTDCMKINDNKLSQEMHGYVSFLQDLPRTQFYLENSQKNLFKIPIQNILAKKIITDSILFFSEYDPLENCRIAFESLPSFLNLHQFLSQVAYIACSELGAERALIAQMNEDGGLDIKATSNISSKEIKTGTMIPKLSSILSKLENTPLFIEENGVVSLTIPLKIYNLNFWILYIESSYAIHALKSINPKCYKEIVWIFSQEIRHALHYAEKNSIDNTPLFSSISIFRKDRLDSIVYESQIMRKLISKTRHVSTTEAPILILGETGVGKELLAQYIHNCSGRHGNFIAVHPASNAENLFESEFFGHEKGAFTSAHKKRIGLVELAHNGTLFIDEVGDIPLAIQTKLLRVFQDRCFWRVGGNNPIESNFRLVGATNKDLWEEVLAGRFRKDLYYRMAVIPLTLPPLRDRKEDIPVLAKLFLSKFSKFYNKNISYSDEIIFDKLLKYDWPGNVRELKSVIERAVILYHGNELKFEIQSKNTDYNNCEKLIQNNDDFTSDLPTLDILEERYIKHVLNITDGKITGKKGALDILGMKRSTFYSKIKNWS
ncbi:MAG: sigma-54-dependent Fis family transcriptional regulator [Desulfovibrionales bacterium]|nr:sigma-54-dependent Fis family transcriptional regulator [Desulfovibrionales bacterium]